MESGLDRFCFAFEANLQLCVVRKLRRQDLDGHRSIESRVARAEDLTHAARTDARDNLIGTETGARSDGCHGIAAIMADE